MEEWRKITETGGRYYVSSAGRVKSVIREARVLTPKDNGRGYFKVTLWIDRKPCSRYIHRLVAEAFIENPYSYPEVNHKDFNPKNNSVDNLEWVSSIQNYRYSKDAGHFTRTDKWKGNLKRTLQDRFGRAVIGTPINGGTERRYKGVNDCKRDGFEPSCVCMCCQGKRQTHKGYTWAYKA